MRQRQLHEELTLWTVTDDGYGGSVFSDPEIIKGRWETRTQKVVSDFGAELMSRAEVYINTDVSVGDYLYQGISEAADPRTVSGALQVQRFDSVPDLRNIERMRVAFL